MLEKQKKRYRRQKKTRAKIKGTKERPRLCIFKSAKHIYAQLIDDEKGKSLVSASDLELKVKSKKENVSHQKTHSGAEKKAQELAKSGKVLVAFKIGRLIAEKAKKIKIGKAVFDRGGCQYHGRIKALAEGAREGGLKF